MKTWFSLLRRSAAGLAEAGLDLVCPPRCAFCRADVPESAARPAPVCGGCTRRLTSDLPRCTACGSPTAPAAECRRCRGRCRDWDGIVVLAAYADEVRAAVLAAKRPGGEVVAAGLATLLAARHGEQLQAWGIDLIVPVPMHWTRRMFRGTSSADGLARSMSAALDVPWCGALVRTRATRMQNELEPRARPANVRDAFRAGRQAAGRRVLLVDDVTTTGGTLSACRSALVAAGAAAVYAAAVARADSAEPGAG